MRLFAVIFLVAGLSGPAFADAGRIEVTGIGTVEAAPDMAVITLGAEAQADTARDAMQQVSDITHAILSRLGRAGIAPRDMQTSDLSLHPVWSNYNSGDTRRITGFSASNRVTVRVRDMLALGGVLDAVLKDGANQFSGLQFTVQNPKPLMQDARRAAVADAREKAELYAEAAGVKLGAVVLISEAGSPAPRPVMMERAMAADSAGVPVAAGEVSLEARVSVIFEIAE
ncbi:SIMPL domain-containing protein [Shimia biformata]|uniref:SIMPL domain-containing protein n=1 Tax=Shimia biformata TaxID=1294299 RepID=UPI0019509D9A|nr:SIMPL domain-containing protein [Shimia biformata]